MNDKKNRVTRKMVNDALRARGRDESLYSGKGYFFFGGGDAVHWLSSSVMFKKISDLTLDEWLAKLSLTNCWSVKTSYVLKCVLSVPKNRRTNRNRCDLVRMPGEKAARLLQQQMGRDVITDDPPPSITYDC